MRMRKFSNGDSVLLSTDRNNLPIKGVVQAAYWSTHTQRWLCSVKWYILEDCRLGNKGEAFCNMQDESDLSKWADPDCNNPNMRFKMLKGEAYGYNQKAKTS